MCWSRSLPWFGDEWFPPDRLVLAGGPLHNWLSISIKMVTLKIGWLHPAAMQMGYGEGHTSDTGPERNPVDSRALCIVAPDGTTLLAEGVSEGVL